MAFLSNLLKSPHFEDDDQNRIAQLLHIVLLAYLASTFSFIIVLPFTSPDMIARMLPVLPFVVIILYLFRLMRRGHVRLAAVILLTLNWFLLTAFAFTTSGVQDSSYISQVLLILFAGFLLGRRAAIALVVIDLVLGLAMIAAENAGHITPVDYPPLADWYSVGTIFVGTLILVFVITRNIDGALSRAKVEIAERKQVEQELRSSEEKYRLLVEHSHQGIVIAQANPVRLRFASQPMQAITGYTPEQLTQFDPTQLVELIHPEDRTRFFSNFTERLAGEDLATNMRYRLMHKNGSVRHVDIHTVLIDYEGQPASQTAFLDVTEQVEAERLKTRFVKEQEKNALIQRIISMLSHDLRTPLSVIILSIDTLDRHYARLNDERRHEKLNTIRRQVQFALELLEDTVNTARGNLNASQFKPAQINLAALCQVSIKELQSTQGRNQTLLFVNKGVNGKVTADEVLVSRILLNLLSNAIKYSPVDSELYLELDCRDSWIVLRVIDQGMGISEDDLPYIFDPFYRASGVHDIHGSGLGLSIVKDCVDRHRGRIHVESTPGQGSTFIVELPADAGRRVNVDADVDVDVDMRA